MLETTSLQNKRGWIFLIVLTAIVLRSPAYFNPIIDEDEAWYATAARVINSGGLLYRDAVDLKPPLIFHFYAFSFSIFGDDLRILHGVTVLWVLATAFVMARITSRLTEQAEAPYLSALLYVLFTPTFVPQALATNGEILMNLPLALSVFWFLESERASSSSPVGFAQTESLRSVLLSGIFCGFAFLFKYQSGILLGVLLAYLLGIKPWLPHRRPEKAAFVQSLFLFGGFVSMLVMLFGLFRYLGNWEDFYFWGWQYNFIFMSDFTWAYFFKRFFDLTPRFVVVWLILWIFGFAAVKRALRSPREILAGQHLVILWLAGSALAVCIGGKFFGHYYIQLLPPLAILAAVSLAAWWRANGKVHYIKWRRVAVLVGIFLPPIIYLATNWREEQKRRRGENQYIQNLAMEVQKLSGDGDKIFIWGRIPELYYFSQRLPASRFITCNFVVGMNTYNYNDRAAQYDYAMGPRLLDWLLHDLAVNRPKLIIDTSPQNFRQYGKYPLAEMAPLRDFLQRNYRMAKTIDRMAIYAAEF
ncbi:glycosyltransferase family 39 protein [candidate division KSB1 bacterium]|nr:glycosyltransferase family 39 protein [candidate division KSB1 bacterium]